MKAADAARIDALNALAIAAERAEHPQDILLSQFNEPPLAEAVERHVSQHHRDFFFLKTEDWASEAEYRFVLRDSTLQTAEPVYAEREYIEVPGDAAQPAVPPLYVGFEDALQHVVLGEKFPTWQLPAAFEVANKAGAQLRKMTWTQGTPFPRALTGRYAM